MQFQAVGMFVCRLVTMCGGPTSRPDQVCSGLLLVPRRNLELHQPSCNTELSCQVAGNDKQCSQRSDRDAVHSHMSNYGVCGDTCVMPTAATSAHCCPREKKTGVGWCSLCGTSSALMTSTHKTANKCNMPIRLQSVE